ncbi:putative transcriptional regulator, Crp/Fnr family [Stanieria cyanosphaera PCC 7437]|uniref:Transcriptional regulator, Crp/Fnr family n=1 Tax=Stanieria cyanosphaera (strain ATCC 29371 / PCC 7437) TaxID=111780 RepID=K9XUZ6_STAC7|nr:Crp/Fnr family transcriptional regulator [Stanieria cyanosphaera]AFZ35884.1 putative transcriptional regulator, Crp/Fnr family [Stanieria cyanosphaera PCC 7437]
MNPKQNHLLDILSEADYQKILPHLQLVRLCQGQILHLPGDIIKELYFPINCLLSITITMINGATAEAGIVGNRDVLGINALMGSRETTQTEYIVQLSGAAFKIKASLMREIFQQNQQFRDVMLQYTQAFIAQICQTTACNRLHVIEQRLARWLLEAQDLVDSNELYLTQEFISNMLGVHRPGVTLAIQKLYERGCIRYCRSEISIVNQKKLEQCSCECFKVVRSEYERILGIKHKYVS